MKSKLNQTLRYAFALEIFFTSICGILVGIEYIIGSGVVTLKGILSCMLVFQMPVVFLVTRHWIRLSKDPFIN